MKAILFICSELQLLVVSFQEPESREVWASLGVGGGRVRLWFGGAPAVLGRRV